MKKKMKRIWALLLASLMVMLSSITVFAANGTVPSASDKEAITVTDVKSDATVNAYQIVQPKYNASGFIGYELVPAVKEAGLSIANLESPTSDEIYTIANKIANGELELTAISMTNDGTPNTTFTAQVGAGEYVVIASGATDVIYNPMLLSVYYSVGGSDNTMASGSVSANDDWKLQGTISKAKSSEPTVTKKITSPADGDGTDGQGSDAAIGDTIGYQIDVTIPSYSAEYKDVEYIISDTLSTGLTPPKDSEVVVKVDNAAPTTAPTITVTGQTITINFDSAYILANGGKTVTVTYSAKLNEYALVNMDANTNTAKIEYSNDPSNKTNHTEKEDKTYVYTFELDGKISGQTVTGNIKTHELIKVDENGNVVSQTFDETTNEATVTNALAGATFTLTNKTTNKVYTATTNDNGYFNGFKGLDAGEYTLVETAAPEGYTIDNTEHSVVITPTYNADGTLQKYEIKIDGKATSTYSATYNADKEITKIESSSETTYIKNTKLQNLPSTGGIGTYIFTVLGVALMVIAAALYMSKRKQA